MLMARLTSPLVKKPCLALAGAQFSEDDNVLVQGVEGSPSTPLVTSALPTSLKIQGKLKAVAVEGVEPSQATVDDGTYPISRPLFIYSDAKILQEKPQVAAFIYFYLSNVNDKSRRGLLPRSRRGSQGSMDAWMTATGK